MSKRKPISKKVRFEVFKRDSFQCQYCGRSAPDVILEVDHIEPCKEGGESELVNFVTSCMDCNRGKGARRISDQSELAKQKKQLNELNERRLQLEMMMKWRRDLAGLEDQKVAFVVATLEKSWQCKANEGTKGEIRKWIKKFTLDRILDAIDRSGTQYLQESNNGYTQESLAKAFTYIPKICSWQAYIESNPHLAEIYKIRSAIRKKFHYSYPHECLSLLKMCQNKGIPNEMLWELVRDCRNWTCWQGGVSALLEEWS